MNYINQKLVEQYQREQQQKASQRQQAQKYELAQPGVIGKTLYLIGNILIALGGKLQQQVGDFSPANVTVKPKRHGATSSPNEYSLPSTT